MKKVITCSDDNGNFQLFLFDSTSEAYDACQCDDEMVDGDCLVIKSEGVVGLVWAWPVAVTEKVGSLHAASIPLNQLKSNVNGRRVFNDIDIDRARTEAMCLGLRLR